MTNNFYLVHLRWPEPCFRAQVDDLDFLRTLVPKGSRVVEAKSEREFLKYLPEATHVIVWHFQAEWFARAGKLKVLATPAAGRELVPVEGPKNVRIHFGHYHGAIMSESVVAFILAWARGFFLKQPTAWSRTWMGDKCFEIAGTKAVIVGYGNVGRAIGKKLEALGVKVVGFGRKNIARLPQESRDADWFILALPSDTGTDDFFNSNRLKKLPRRCVVINVGRGNAIDEKVLFAALKAKRIAGAYLDVRKSEPCIRLGNAMPSKAPALDNLVLMPHASAFSPNYVKRCFQELKDDRCL